MNIHDFISRYKNHPIMFVGTGMSRRYLLNSYTWEELLKKIALDLTENEEYFLELKNKYFINSEYDYAKIGTELEKYFNSTLYQARNGKFKEINDKYYDFLSKNIHVSRFKIYISEILKSISYRKEMEKEIAEFKKIRKNIGSVITTNYDCLIEDIFDFSPLVGNDILLSNPYGSVYKIHGCVNYPDKIIINERDYEEFNSKYELIRAQLLSLFIHNPIIFIGYSIKDVNIKCILKTIFTYVDYDNDLAEKIRNNFLLVEYDNSVEELDVVEHDIDIENKTIRINKIKTNNFSGIFSELSNLLLPVSVMDIRKVENAVKDICSGGDIKVKIAEDLDSLANSDKILVIGSRKTVKYEYQTTSEMMINYFNIIEESDSQIVSLINKQKIKRGTYFPIYGFYRLNQNINQFNELSKQQQNKLDNFVKDARSCCCGNHKTVEDIESDLNIKATYKRNEIVKSTMNGCLDLENLRNYLVNYPDKKNN
ncbi:MAG: SIR2 family protein [Desulfovibrionaceae bacterium]|nr:SIR2 family protein [Desulfovibrionaceae bacterium]